MQWFRVDLKTFLGLAMPNQYSQTVRKQILSWFWGDNFGPKSPNLPIYIVLLYYMILHAAHDVVFNTAAHAVVYNAL